MLRPTQERHGMMIYARRLSPDEEACDNCSKAIRQRVSHWATKHKSETLIVCGSICMRRLTEKLAMEERNAIHPNKL